MNGISISNSSGVPIYQQIFEQISSSIIRGELVSDFPLPPIRRAARELQVSIITVKKAWEELEREGLIYTSVGKGCFVSNLTKDERESIKRKLLLERIKIDLKYYKNYGVDMAGMVSLIKDSF